MLIDAYHTKVAPHLMQDPMMLLTIQQSLIAFINDVMIHATVETPEQLNKLTQKAQWQQQWWDQLIQVTGGALNPQKCYGLLYKWEDNIILKVTQPDLTQYNISLSHGQTQQQIIITGYKQGHAI